MNRFLLFLMLFCVCFVLPSCEFSCSVGNKDEPKGTAVIKDGTRIYNQIDLQSNRVKLDKAYLLFDNGDRVPDDNFVDFKRPVRLHLLIDSGWVEQNGKVMLGAAETITAENGRAVLQEEDLFEKYPSGIPAADAKAIYLSAALQLKEGALPTSFTVSFNIWDKNGDGFIKGSYKLYSR